MQGFTWPTRNTINAESTVQVECSQATASRHIIRTLNIPSRFLATSENDRNMGDWQYLSNVSKTTSISPPNYLGDVTSPTKSVDGILIDPSSPRATEIPDPILISLPSPTERLSDTAISSTSSSRAASFAPRSSRSTSLSASSTSSADSTSAATSTHSSMGTASSDIIVSSTQTSAAPTEIPASTAKENRTTVIICSIVSALVLIAIGFGMYRRARKARRARAIEAQKRKEIEEAKKRRRVEQWTRRDPLDPNGSLLGTPGSSTMSFPSDGGQVGTMGSMRHGNEPPHNGR